MPETVEQLLTTKDLCKLLQVSWRTLMRWQATGQIPQPIKVAGRTHRWRREAIEQFLDQRAG